VTRPPLPADADSLAQPRRRPERTPDRPPPPHRRQMRDLRRTGQLLCAGHTLGAVLVV